jgi:hypothetical protein
MTIFYRGHAVRITHEVFEWRLAGRRSFVIRELFGVCISRGTTRSLVVLLPTMNVCSKGLAGPAVVLTAVGGPVLGRPPLSAAALVVVLASALMWLGSRVTDPRPYQLWAWYRGDWVCLYQDFDSLVFGQVSRGLMRALEHLDETS